VEVGFYDTPGWTGDVTLAGGYVFIADGPGGLLILRYTGGEVSYSLGRRDGEWR